MSSTVTKQQPVTKRERRQAELEARRSKRERERKQRDKALLQNAALALLFFGVLLAVAFTLDEGDASYGKAQGALLFVSAGAALLLIIMRESLSDIVRSLRRVLTSDPTLDTHDKAMALWGAVFIVAAATVLFVVDYGAFASTGFRITAVAAVPAVKLARTAFASFQR